ncbi:MAG: ABC transporter permease, partial [Armatimonadaceae bacterium]
MSMVTDIITYAAPVGLACYGGLISEKVGIVQISLEGMMLIGALAAVIATSLTGSPVIGILAAMLCALLTAALHGVFTLLMRSDHVIVGTAVNFLAIGITGVLSRSLQKSNPTILKAQSLSPLLFGMNFLTLLFLLLIPVLWWLLYRTRLGIGLTATGEHPKAVTAAGYNVFRYRFFAGLGCGAICGLAGAALSIGISNNFTDNMTASRGFVALALIVVGRWSPIWTAVGTVGFASLDVLQATLQAGGNTWLPYPILLALPYILTLVALGTAKAAVRPPRFLGITND